MIPIDCKHIAEVSRHVAREKSIRHGHPSTLHLWWARPYWNEVTKMVHYYLAVNAMTKPMQVHEDMPTYGGKS
jgi:hypothetical protein